jgi:two-component system, NarL family, nitrate/nitrite response regulator NarL
MTLRVLIVSDVRIVLEGLSSALAQRAGMRVVGTVNMQCAREEIARLNPELALFDATRHDSVELVKGLVVAAPDTRFVAFGVKETAEEFLALAAAGTAGYVSDSAGSSDLVTVLERVMCDELPCSPRAAASLYRHVATLSQEVDETVNAGNGHSATAALSRRELQIAHLVDCGLTNKEIGRQLGIEAATVKNHVHNLCEKLKVHRRGEAAARIRAIARAAGRSLGAAPDATPAPDVR